jgi:transcriptional antiterminator
LFKEEAEEKDIDVAWHVVDEIVKFFEEQIRVNKNKKFEIRIFL